MSFRFFVARRLARFFFAWLAGAWVVSMTAPVMASKDKGVVLIHAGYGTTQSFRLQGRVVRDKGISPPKAEQGRWRNVIDSVKTLETDELEAVQVEVDVAGVAYQARTDSDGVWLVVADRLERPLTPGLAPVRVRAVGVTDFEIPEASGVVHIIGDGPGVALVSDFDDTVVNSQVTDKASLAYRTLTKNAAQLEAINGVAQAYEAARQAGVRCFFYVSGSPQNLHERIADFLKMSHVPQGPILLKNFGEDALAEQIAYKTDRISGLFTYFKDLRFVLVGDSGEKDPEIYRAIAAKFPGRVQRIIIREVPGAQNSEARLAGMLRVPDYRDTELIARLLTATAAPAPKGLP